MKRFFAAVVLLALLLTGCSAAPQPEIAATTLPVWQFTQAICRGTDLRVGRLVTESVSCLHDYTLTVNQMRAIEGCQVLVMNGAGLEEFLEPAMEHCSILIDASYELPLLPGEEEYDPHIWLSPEYAMGMAKNICWGLSELYPQYADSFEANLEALNAELQALSDYAEAQLADLGCRELITFHDGFAYFAQAHDLTILAAMEEEAGSEASAADLKELITLTDTHQLPAIFTETNGSTSAAQVIRSATGAECFALDMAMAGDDYFDAMYRNIDTIKEALG